MADDVQKQRWKEYGYETGDHEVVSEKDFNDDEVCDISYSVADEYAIFLSEFCARGGVLIPVKQTLVTVRGAGENKYYDRIEMKCLICGETRSFLFDINEFYPEEMKMSPSQIAEVKRQVGRARDMASTNAFHCLVRQLILPDKPSAEPQHSNAYFYLRDSYENPIAAREALKNQKILEQIRELAKKGKG